MIALLLAAAIAAPLTRVEDTPRPTVITNVAVMDTDGHTGPRQDVVLADGRIVQAYDPRTVSVPQLEERIYA